MRNIKILHTADIHIGEAQSFLGAIAEKRRFETLLTFERIIDLAKEKEVDIIAIAGDLFDSNDVDREFVNAVFGKIEQSQIPTVVALGNHDPLSSNSPFLQLELPKNLHVFNKNDECITFESLNLKVYGRSFADTYLKGEESFPLSVDKNYVNIMVQHGELKSDLSSDYNSITPNFIKNSGMDYIALGHIHKRTPIGKMGETHFAYSGCPEGQGFDELDEKGVFIGEIGKGVCNLEFVPVSKRKHIHHKCDISDFANIAEICEKIINEFKNEYGDEYTQNLYKIELIGEILPDVKISTAEISSRLEDKLYFVKVKDSTSLKLDLDALTKELSLKGIFAKKMLEKMADAEEDEKKLYEKALKIGLKAFIGEVKYDED